MKSFTVSTRAYSASLHPSMSSFVVGGEDFKIYKMSYDDGKELGKYSGFNYFFFLFESCFMVF